MRVRIITVYAEYKEKCKKLEKNSGERTTGSLGKVNIPFCRQFDKVFGKNQKILKKVKLFNFFQWKLPKIHDFSMILGAKNQAFLVVFTGKKL